MNTNNQITSSGFSYDAAGDLTGDGVYTYTWNAGQHLNSAANVTYTYDGDLRRVEKSSGTLYWYCAVCGQVLAESDLSGNITSEYALFNRQRIARRDVASGNVYYLFHDRLGSYRTLTDSTGNAKGQSDYYPFGGERVISSTVTDSFRFAGMEWDSEDGLNHTLHRQYTPAQCRWETPDPVQGCVNFPQGQNLYGYVKDNPANSTDPGGNFTEPGGCDPRCCDPDFNLENPDACPSWCPPNCEGGADEGGGGAGATPVTQTCLGSLLFGKTRSSLLGCVYTMWCEDGWLWVGNHRCNYSDPYANLACPKGIIADCPVTFFPTKCTIANFCGPGNPG